MIHTTKRRPVPCPADVVRSPTERALDDLMHALYAARRVFSAAERRTLGQAVRMLRKAALGEREG